MVEWVAWGKRELRPNTGNAVTAVTGNGVVWEYGMGAQYRAVKCHRMGHGMNAQGSYCAVDIESVMMVRWEERIKRETLAASLVFI